MKPKIRGKGRMPKNIHLREVRAKAGIPVPSCRGRGGLQGKFQKQQREGHRPAGGQLQGATSWKALSRHC